MALAIEPVGTWGTPVATNSAATTFTITGVTIPAGTGLCLVVGASYQGTGNPTSVVWDAAGANEGLTLGPTANDGTVQTVLYYLIGPTPGASKSITLTWGSNRSAIGAACAAFANVNGGIGSTATGATNGTPSLTIATVVHGLAIDYLGAATNPALGPSQNSYHDGAPAGANITNADGSYEFPVSLPDSQPVMSWVMSNFYVQAAMALNPAVPALALDEGSLRVPNNFHLFAASNR